MSQNVEKISKWWKGYPCLLQFCSEDHFINGCGHSTSHRTDFGKQTIQNSVFIHNHGDVCQKRRHFCPRRSKSYNLIFGLRIGLLASQLHTTQCSRRTGYHKMCVFLSTGTMLPEERGQNRCFETALLNL